MFFFFIRREREGSEFDKIARRDYGKVSRVIFAKEVKLGYYFDQPGFIFPFSPII